MGPRGGGGSGRGRGGHAPEPAPPKQELSEAERELVTLAINGDGGELRRLVELRVPELVAYQDEAYARRYAEAVRRVHVAEQERTPGHAELAEAVARQLFKLMAYKDEYEVARLHLDAVEQAQAAGRVRRGRQGRLQPASADASSAGPEAQAPARRLVHPRVPGALPDAPPARHQLDPFGLAGVRRVERQLIGEYEEMVAEALVRLTPETHATALELLELPDVIRGYEEIKLRNVALFRKRAQPLRKRLTRPA